VSVEDEYSPDYSGESGASNAINLRGQLPYDGASWLVRFKQPIVTQAPPESITGAGDFALWDLAVLDAGHMQWLAGATLRIPTARDSLGSNKYSLGPAFGDTVVRDGVTYGFFTQDYFSVIGPSWYPSVAKSQVNPVAKFDLAAGWSVGLSTMQFTYDWTRNRWTDVPLGFRIGKRLGGAMRPADAYFEAEKNFAVAAGTPSWTLRTFFAWRLSSGANSPANDDGDQ
jgi:hypothetical protein